MFLFFQEILNSCAEFSGAHAVYNTHFFQIGQHGGIEKGFHFGKSFLDGQADNVDFQAGNGSWREIFGYLNVIRRFSAPSFLGFLLIILCIGGRN